MKKKELPEDTKPSNDISGIGGGHTKKNKPPYTNKGGTRRARRARICTHQ